MLMFTYDALARARALYYNNLTYIVGATANDGKIVIRVTVSLQTVNVRTYIVHQCRKRFMTSRLLYTV